MTENPIRKAKELEIKKLKRDFNKKLEILYTKENLKLEEIIEILKYIELIQYKNEYIKKYT